MKRRDLLKLSSLAPLAWLAPGALHAAINASANGGSVRRLILVEFNGGNDGLNAVVPYANERYYALRPQIAVARDQVLQLDEHVGLNPAMSALMPLFADKQLAVIQGVGYEQANRSHFRSIEIWDTATDSNKISNDGWLSRIQPASLFGREFAASSVVIGRNPKPLSGGSMQPVVMADSNSFVREARGVKGIAQTTQNAALRHVLTVQEDIEIASNGLAQQRPVAPGEFPKTPFGRDAAEAARLLIGDPATPIVKIALTGFDTHAGQRGRQDGLLKQFAETMAALRASLTEAGIWNDTLVMTYSEFGRRAQQNGSGGTDHGKAAPHFVLGGAVKGGLYGPAPDLAHLDEGDVAASIDYRSVYNAVLGGWWNASSALIEPARFKALDLV